MTRRREGAAMHPYTAADTLRIAKRYNNPKRSYLLVNPLQAKHIPVSPAAALEMMGALGDQVAAKYPEARLVIGFAETATAIGAAVAARLGPDCLYVHTTREALDGDWILFREEHSHAAEHRLCADQLADWIDRSPAIVFVDDEFSTGRTLINMVQQLRERYPRLGERRLAAASILSRVSPENQARLAEAGIAVNYIYSTIKSAEGKAIIMMKTSDAAKAEEVLKASGVELAGADSF